MNEEDHYEREIVYEELCKRLLTHFPDTAPEVVTDKAWGEYGEARTAFRLHGSHWSCTAVFRHRSMLGFVNDEAYLFLLPRFLACARDPDIFDSVVYSLRDKLPRFATLLSQDQRASLVAVLQQLLDWDNEDGQTMSDQGHQVRRILAALREDR